MRRRFYGLGRLVLTVDPGLALSERMCPVMDPWHAHNSSLNTDTLAERWVCLDTDRLCSLCLWLQKFGIKMAGPMLVDTKTKYQHLQVFDSETYGRVLVLDGAIQVRTQPAPRL